MTNDRIPKMPSMKHLPWSQEDARQQKWLRESQTTEMFLGEEVVITEKLDGANACITSEKVYARSHSAEPHRDAWDYLKKKHREELMHKISDKYAYFGEYLYARHSIKYERLPSYFIVFGVYDRESGRWLSWDKTEILASEIGLPTSPELGRYIVSTVDALKEMPEGESFYGPVREGYVVRRTEGFDIEDLDENMAKCVREDHVQTDELHWRKGNSIETNDLSGGAL